jgi:HAD superfamily hydrolase (TIGR01509 family)
MMPGRYPLRRPKAVIFDMDGLMLDTEPLAARAWSEAAAALGVEFDNALALSMVGRNFADCQAIVRQHYGDDYPVDALLSSWHAAYDAIVSRDGLALKPGVHELIDWLDVVAIPRAVATSTRRSRARSKLEATELLRRFHDLVGGDEVPRGKPAPDIYLEAARRLKVPPGDCIALEDSEPGIRAAYAAGTMPIMVPDLHPPSADLIAHGVLILPTLHAALHYLIALPA